MTGCATFTRSQLSTTSSCGLTETLPPLRSANPLVVFRPLQGGVNALLPSSVAQTLRGLLERPMRLRLHAYSAGGTYMVRPPDACGATRGVFKPREEEIGQPRNPHGNARSERAAEFVPGSGSRREVLAFLLDHAHSAGVVAAMEVTAAQTGGDVFSAPPFPVRPVRRRAFGGKGAKGAKGAEGAEGEGDWRVGCLQHFVPGCVEAADVLPGEFPVEDVHRIAVFDIRTLNADRHGGNVLVCYAPNTPRLIPIDHSYICPTRFADPEFEWLSWPQSKVPFSDAALAYVERLDPIADAALVRAGLGGRDAGSAADANAAAEVMRCTTQLLQSAALQYDMCANQIGHLCRRRTLVTPSVLEELMEEARDEAWQIQPHVFEELLHQRLQEERKRGERE